MNSFYVSVSLHHVYRVVPVAAVQLIERLKKDIRMIIPV